MKKQVVATLAVYLTAVIALPPSQPRAVLSPTASPAVELLPADVHGPDIKALQSTPANMTASLRAFLDKYQPLSNNASQAVGKKTQAVFTSSGHCYADYPCFSVERGAMTTIGPKEEVTQDQVSAVLDHLTASLTVTFDKSRPDSPLSGLLLTTNQATLQVVAPRGTMRSDLLAGMVFDMYKMQHDNPATNSIRAVQAKSDDQTRPFVAICLYPEGADADQAYHFCIGSDLPDVTTGPPLARVEKRFSFEGAFSTLCGLIKIPLLCHEDHKS